MDKKSLNKKTKAVLIDMLIKSEIEALAEKLIYENQTKKSAEALAILKADAKEINLEIDRVMKLTVENAKFVDAVNEYNKLPFNKRMFVKFPSAPN